MQKKLIALAIAGLAAAPVFAQSSTNVTIYGLVDMGYSWRGDHVLDNVGSMSSIDSGLASGSRLGFKGSEDLGNGLKAIFTFETGINADRGTNGQGGLAWGRQTYVGLTGNNWGTVIAGRFNTPQYNLWINTDPFATGTMGTATNAMPTPAGTDRLNFVYRVDNAVAYVSPSFYGFNITGAYSTNAIGQESIGNDSDAYVWTVSPVYNNGPLMVGANYHQITFKGAGDYKLKNWDVGATYDFNFLKIHAGYNDFSDSGPGSTKYDSSMWMAGVTVPVSSSLKILASYSDFNDSTPANADGYQWAIGLVYNLSKRTDLYATYAQTDNDNNSQLISVNDAGNTYTGYQQGAQFGLRHRF